MVTRWKGDREAAPSVTESDNAKTSRTEHNGAPCDEVRSDTVSPSVTEHEDARQARPKHSGALWQQQIAE